MSMYLGLFNTIGVVIYICVAAHGNAASVASAIPTPRSLGTGWLGVIEVLVDSTSKPTEIIDSSRHSESTLNEWRRSASDTNCTLSGWSRARFDYISQSATNRYYVYIERFRSKAALTEQFNRLLAPDPVRQRSLPRDIGEAAVVEREDGAVALWFRRGSFRVEVSSYGGTPAGAAGGSMRHLADKIDKCIIAAEGASR